MTGITCNACQCSRCDNVDCGWHGCILKSPKETCFIAECIQYQNEQEDIEEGFLDGYE